MSLITNLGTRVLPSLIVFSCCFTGGSTLSPTFMVSVFAPPLEAGAKLQDAAGKPNPNISERIEFDFHRMRLGDKPDNVYLRATLDHEMVHSFRSFRLIDQDIPTAAAMGYYREWVMSGTLREPKRLHEFAAAKALDNPSPEAQKLMAKYKGVDTETAQSYADGSRLAGLLAHMFAKDDQSVMVYVLALSMGLEGQAALRMTADRTYSKVIFGFRLGKYFVVSERLNEDLNDLTDDARNDAAKYINGLADTYEPGLVPKNQSVILGPITSLK